MKRYVAAAIALIALSPVFVFAANAVPAGFAPTSIFASKTNITAGDSIVLFTVLYNSSADDLSADVIFTIDGKDVGTKHVSLGSGETQTPSVPWTATEGSHAASARIENVVGSSDPQISLLNDKADTITLTVSPPPPPTPTTQAVQNVTNIVQNATPVAQTAINSLENLRENAVNTLTSQLAAASPASSTPKGSVLGAETYRAPDDGSDSATSAGSSGILGTIWRGILQGLLFICNIQILFYLLLLLVLYILYKLVRMVFAERH